MIVLFLPCEGKHLSTYIIIATHVYHTIICGEISLTNW